MEGDAVNAFEACYGFFWLVASDITNGNGTFRHASPVA